MVVHYLQRASVFRLLLPYLLGLLLAPCRHSVPWSLLLWAAFCLFLQVFFVKRSASSWDARWLPGFGFFLCWTALGIWNMNQLLEKATLPETMEPFIAQVCIIELPVEKEKSYSMVVDVLSTTSGCESWYGKKVQVSLPKKQLLNKPMLGTIIMLQLSPTVITSPTYPGAFDYARWLRFRGICGTAFAKTLDEAPSNASALLLDKVARTESGVFLRSSYTVPNRFSFLHLKVVAENLRSRLAEQFRRGGIEHQELALVTALVLGTRTGLESSTTNAFTATGISHILSVSGLHVAIIYGVLAFLLSLIDPKGRFNLIRQVFLISFLIAYAFVTGLSPSVCRSAFMFSMMALGKCLGRKSFSVNTVLFTAWILLLIQPGFVMDLGFQLSYLSVLSLLVVHPKLVSLWTPGSVVVRRLWELCCLSMTAQLGTAPLTIHTFGVFPTYFLMNNLVAVPFSSLLLYLAMSYLSLYWIPGVGSYIAGLLSGCLTFFLKLTESASQLPHALISGLHLNRNEVLCFYGLMICFFAWVIWNRRRWIFPFLLFCLVCESMLILHRFGF